MLTESSVSLLTGTFPGCYTKENYAYREFSITPYWDIPRVAYLQRRSGCVSKCILLTGTIPSCGTS